MSSACDAIPGPLDHGDAFGVQINCVPTQLAAPQPYQRQVRHTRMDHGHVLS